MADTQRAPVMPRYGPTGFVAAVATAAVVETAAAWPWSTYFLISLYLFGIASAIVLPVAVYLLLAGGKAAQIGRGMLIGYLATPLTAVIVIIPIAVVTLLH